MYVATNTMLHLSDGFGARALPTEIDLGAHDMAMQLARFEAVWTVLPARLRATAIAELRLSVPAPDAHTHGVILLPGGAVALRAGLEGVLVADPHSAAALGRTAAAALRMAVAAAPGTQTLVHLAEGIALRPSLPTALPAQSCSLITDATVLAAALPAAARWTGRAIVQWRDGGAVAWRLVAAPSVLALAASLSASVIEPGARPLASGAWQAVGQAARLEQLAPGLFDRVNDLLVDEVNDTLRYALAERAVTGTDCVADRVIEALRLLPGLFGPDHRQDAGAHLLAAWPRAQAALQGQGTDLAMIGIEGGVAGPEGLAALRAVLDREGLLFAERPAAARMVVLGGRAARTAADRLDEGNRFGVLIAPPSDPAALFALAESVSRRTGVRVVAAAPCWNFYHRLDARTDTEAGNAAWFGMGAGLDELEWL